MSFGIITRGKDGSIYFDGSRRALRVIHHQEVSSTFQGDIPVSGITPQNSAALCIPRTNVPYDRNLDAEVFDGLVRLRRYNSAYPPKTSLDLIVLGYA